MQFGRKIWKIFERLAFANSSARIQSRVLDSREAQPIRLQLLQQKQQGDWLYASRNYNLEQILFRLHTPS